MAWAQGSINLPVALLTLVGCMAMHASVNMLNDYFDFRSGLDVATSRTPFSGGSGVLPAGELTPNSVLYAGIGTLLLGSGVGWYLVYNASFDPVLITILALAIISVAGYSSLLSHWGVGELSAGGCLGTLLVMGTYYLQTGSLAAQPVLVGASLGILVAGILYNNEFPDSQADEKTGRRHLVIRWGKSRAAHRFRILMVSAYAIIVAGVVAGLVAPIALISLLALPKAWTATKILKDSYEGPNEQLIPGMASTVMATLLTGALLFVGYVVWHFV